MDYVLIFAILSCTQTRSRTKRTRLYHCIPDVRRIVMRILMSRVCCAQNAASRWNRLRIRTVCERSTWVRASWCTWRSSCSTSWVTSYVRWRQTRPAAPWQPISCCSADWRATSNCSDTCRLTSRSRYILQPILRPVLGVWEWLVTSPKGK